MKKYKYSRTSIENKIAKVQGYKYSPEMAEVMRDLLATTEPESDKESKCDCHERNDGYWCCLCKESHYRPGGVILTNDVKKFNTPQEELEVDELGKGKWMTKLGNNLTEITDKLNSLIKAHNALVKEVKGL